MTIEYKLPDLGEDIETGDVISVYVSPGDKVSEEQALMELETDKAALEIPSPADGVIKEVHVKEGETIKVGQLLVTIDDGGDGGEPDKAEANKEPEPEEKREKAEEEKEPEKEAKEEKSQEKKEAPVEDEAEEEELEAKEPEEEPEEETAEAEQSEKEPEERKAEVKEPAPDNGGAVPASPTVRRIAREMGVDIREIKGTGPGGRISEEDVKAYSGGETQKQEPDKKEPEKKPEPKETKQEGPAPIKEKGKADTDKWGRIERVEVKKVRRLTAERLSEAWKAPHVTQHDKADITEMEKLRKHYGKEVAEAGGKLTMTSIILKVIASALKTFPQFNASIDMESGEIIYKHYYNIGVAVDTDRGLLVPVIKDADEKNIEELSIDLSVLSEKARTKKISVEELQGGTFTISNLGGLGGTYFTPVVNAPEVAILGVSRSVMEPVYIDGEFQPRLMLPLSLSYDHRLIDGADAVRFVRWVVEALEEPFKLSLEG